jgi:hypothetical protein
MIAKLLQRKTATAGGGGGGAFTPSQLTGLQRWYSATDVVTSGTNVTQFNDKSGGTNHATQATGTKQPVLKTNQGSGFQTVSFDGVDDIINFASMTLTGDFTIYWIGYMREADGNGGGFFGEAEASLNSLNTYLQGTYWFTGSGDIVYGNNNAITNGLFCEIVARRTGTTVTIEVNGVTNSTSGPVNANPVIGQIGRVYTGYAKVDLAEFLVYNQYHDNATKSQVLSWADQTYVAPYPLSLPVSGAALWLDASQQSSLFTDAGATNVNTDGQAVYQWNDLSGNSRTALQTTLANRPLYRSPASGHNGLSTTSYDGSNDFFSVSNTENWGLVFSGDYTIDLWAKFTSNTAQQDLLGQDAGGGFQPKWILGLNNPGVAGAGVLGFLYNTSTSSNYTFGVSWTPANNILYRITVTRSGNDTKFYINGTQQGATNTSTNRPRAATNIKLTVGQDGENYRYTKGQFGEVLFFPFAYSASDMTAMSAYSLAKWGVS